MMCMILRFFVFSQTTSFSDKKYFVLIYKIGGDNNE